MHEALLIVGAVLSKRTVYNAADATSRGAFVQAAGDVVLVEERDDFVAGLEAAYVLANGFDCAGAVGGCYDVIALRERVQALGDDEVAVVKGGAVDYNYVSATCCCLEEEVNLHLTRTSLSPNCGMGSS